MKFSHILFGALAFSLIFSCQEQKQGEKSKKHPITNATPREKALKIAFFHGGRCHHLYRTFLKGYFDKEGVEVDMYTSFVNEQMDFAPLPKDAEFVSFLRHHPNYRMGRTTGTSIIRAMEQGTIDGGCVGESSFIQLAQRGFPMVAILQLGHNFKGQPGFAILTKPGWYPKSAKELKGKVIGSRRAGPADELIARELVMSAGLDPDKDVTIISQMSDDLQHGWIKDGKLDAGVFHMFGMVKHIHDGKVNYWKTIDFMDVEMLTAILVVHPRLLKERPEDLKKLVYAYSKNLADEELNSKAEVGGEKEDKFWKSFGVITRYEYLDMRLPGASYPPYFSEEKMFNMQSLLGKHFKSIKKDFDLKPFMNQKYVKQFMNEYGSTLEEIQNNPKKWQYK